MPIPPRPIPQRQARPLPLSSTPGTPTRHHHTPHSTTRPTRPGFSVPQKAPSASLDALTANSLEWRAEVALLEGLPRFRCHAQRGVGSAPSGAGTGAGGEEHVGGVVMMTSSEKAREEVQRQDSERRREGREVRVDLEGLIEQGRGKREKRVTTATSLGFDFIPNPRVIASGSAPSPSPSTPALIPSSSSPAPPSSPLCHAGDDEEQEDLGWEMEWEHVALPASRSSAPARVAAPCVRQEDADDGDMIILGEMELDGPEHDEVYSRVESGKGKGKGKRAQGLSYAAVLGRVR